MSPRCGCSRDGRKVERGGPSSWRAWLPSGPGMLHLQCSHSAKLAWRRRWLRLLSVSCARSFASSLVALPTALHALGGADGCAPDLADLFAE